MGERDDAPEGEELRAFYAKYRQEFSAADLQRYTEIEEGVPLEQVIAKMEEIYRQFKAAGG